MIVIIYVNLILFSLININMTKRHYRRTRKNRSSGYRRRSQRGGYSSASSYGTYVDGGTIGQQFRDTFGQNHFGNTSNSIVGAQQQNSGLSGQPNSSNLALVQAAGRRRRRKGYGSSMSRKKRGGFFPIISQAAAPLGLLALQQTYKKKSRSPYDRHR